MFPAVIYRRDLQSWLIAGLLAVSSERRSLLREMAVDPINLGVQLVSVSWPDIRLEH